MTGLNHLPGSCPFQTCKTVVFVHDMFKTH
jgi:hypothetical protein